MKKYFYCIIAILITLYSLINAEIIYSPRKLQESQSSSFFFIENGFIGKWKTTQNSLNKFLLKDSGKAQLKVFKEEEYSSEYYTILLYDGESIIDNMIFIHSNRFNQSSNSMVFEGELKIILNNHKTETCNGISIFNLEDNNLNGTLISENCDLNIILKASPIISDELQKPIVSYSFVITCVSIALIFAYSKHAQDCTNSDATARKTSIDFLVCQGLIDLYYSLWHLYLSTIYYQAFDYLILASFMSFSVYLVIHGKLLTNVWKNHYPQYVQEGLEGFRIKYSIFEGYNLIFITSFIPIVLIFKEFYIAFIVISHSFLPQIVLTARKGYKNSIKSSVIIMIALSRLSLLLYLFGCPVNFRMIPTDYKLCLGLIIYFFIQTAVVLIQNKSPRFFLPRCCRPKIYSYFREIDEEKGIEASECIICMTALNLLGHENPEVINFSRAMHAPCRHIFHEDCLSNWMSLKMECPTCRSSLPLIEE